MSTTNTKYEAIRALAALDEARASPDYVSDTFRLPMLEQPASDDTVPMLPALLRPQAE